MADESETIEQVLADLQEAKDRYDTASANYDAARRDQTAALNSLNEAQKRFDKAADAVRDKPPWNSEWHQQRERKTRQNCAG